MGILDGIGQELGKHLANLIFKDVDKTRSITRDSFLKAGLVGGLVAGFVGTILISVVRYVNGKNPTPIPTGFENMSSQSFPAMVGIVLFFQSTGGALLGWLCCRLAWPKSFIGFFHFVLVFVVAFCVIVPLRQMMARDAWVRAGEYRILDSDGNTVRMGGGPLGEPDFETIATGMMGGTSLLILVRSLQKVKPRVPTFKSGLGIVLLTTIAGTISWCFVFFINYLLTNSGILTRGNYLYSTALFVVDFPHPERPIFAALLCSVYVVCLLTSIQLHANKSGIISS